MYVGTITSGMDPRTLNLSKEGCAAFQLGPALNAQRRWTLDGGPTERDALCMLLLRAERKEWLKQLLAVTPAGSALSSSSSPVAQLQGPLVRAAQAVHVGRAKVAQQVTRRAAAEDDVSAHAHSPVQEAAER